MPLHSTKAVACVVGLAALQPVQQRNYDLQDLGQSSFQVASALDQTEEEQKQNFLENLHNKRLGNTPGYTLLLGPTEPSIPLARENGFASLRLCPITAISPAREFQAVEEALDWGSEKILTHEYRVALLPEDLFQQANRDELKIQVLLWDKEGNKEVLSTPAALGDSRGILFGLPKDFQISQIAVEALLPDGAQEVRDAAVVEARERGLRVLPYLPVGERTDFSLTALSRDSAKATQSLEKGEDFNHYSTSLSDFAGKILVIDESAQWCGSCTTIVLPELVELQKRYGEKLAVIYVAHEGDSNALEATNEKIPQNWNLVYVPLNSDFSRLWHQASLGSKAGPLPRVTIIDSTGVVRDLLVGGVRGKVTSAVESVFDSFPPPAE
ncbi:MAG: redoxin family protein [Bdellovibrionales bacterium]|nr:redoxin family protein [Bdellovibrionales bacterium]